MPEPTSELIHMPGMRALAQHLAKLIAQTGSGDWHTFTFQIRADGSQVWVDDESLVPVKAAVDV